MFSSSQRRGRRFRPVLDTLPGRIAPTVFLPPPPTSIDPGPLTPGGPTPTPDIWVDAGLQPVTPAPTDACMVDGLLLC